MTDASINDMTEHARQGAQDAAKASSPVSGWPMLHDWLDRFAAKNGRPLRVLHVGNIANNAYLNAKMLRLAGVEADVLCHDYYHIMGCPEWEDAEIERHWKDDFAPNWAAAGIGDFRRPAWFFQGPLIACFATMRSRTVTNPAAKSGLRLFGKLMNFLASSERSSVAAARIQSRIYQVLRTLALGKQYIRMRLHALGAATDTRFAFEGVLKSKFAARFQDRPQLVAADLGPHFFAQNTLRSIFEYYDVVHCYGTTAIAGLIAGSKPYAAYEHGTIRSIPFQDDALGKMTALAYREADHVFITNCDAIRAAQKLSLPDYSFIPHPVNEDHTGADGRVAALRVQFEKEYGADFVIFHPARHHWTDERHPSWEKGNDLFVRGFAEFLKTTNPRALAVFVEWGHSVAETKSLLKELGIADRVLWITPQPNRAMVRYILASDVVADQFFLGAFGSLTPKAMLCGRPVLLNLDEDIHRWAFEEMPPVENVKSPEQITTALTRLYTDESYRLQKSRQCLDWYWKYHSGERIRADLVSVYRKLLDKSDVESLRLHNPEGRSQ